MEWWAAIDVVIVLAVLITPLVWLLLRRRWLTRQGGLFDCGLRFHHKKDTSRWVLGVARYTGEYLEWFPVFSASFRPKLRVYRPTASVIDQRRPEYDEAANVYGGSQIVMLRDSSGISWELAMSSSSLTGLMSWLESAPPGQRYDDDHSNAPHSKNNARRP